MNRAFRKIVTGAAMSLIAVTHADALNTRTWISGKGTDAIGCGPITTPCRSLQFAHDQTSPGGEIDVLDGAGYGAVVITKAINIVNEGAGVAGVLASSGGSAMTINAGGSDAVVLRGLAIEGANVGTNGIVFNSGGSLTVANCLLQNFVGNSDTAGNGIVLRHTTGSPSIVVTNTTSSNNGFFGMFFRPTGSGGGKVAVTGLTVSNNQYGFGVFTGNSNSSSMVSVAHSYALNNSQIGFQFYGANGGAVTDGFLADSFTSGSLTGIYANGSSMSLIVGRTTATASGNPLITNNSTTCSIGGNLMVASFNCTLSQQ